MTQLFNPNHQQTMLMVFLFKSEEIIMNKTVLLTGATDGIGLLTAKKTYNVIRHPYWVP